MMPMKQLMKLQRECCALLLTGLSALGAFAQDKEPAEKTLPPVPVEEPRPAPDLAAPPSLSMEDMNRQVGIIPWNSNEIQSDTDLVGPYGQPVWTTQRPWATTRSYVLPPGTVNLEQWYRPTFNRGKKQDTRWLEEIAIGLPGRFQLDVYERWHTKTDDNNNLNAAHEGVQIELRWALANWGDIFMNPTLYAEWIQRNNVESEPDKYELKLLLSDSFFHDKIFYACNFILEQEVSGERETEYGFAQAVSWTVVERKLMAGIEMRYQSDTVQGGRDNPTHDFAIGPSVQWRPTNRTFVDVVPLIGIGKDSPHAQLYVIAGIQFGNRAGPTSQIGRPAVARGN